MDFDALGLDRIYIGRNGKRYGAYLVAAEVDEG